MPWSRLISARKRRLVELICQLAHFLAGVITAFTATRYPVLAVLQFATFVIYEVNEDWHLWDGAFKDILFYGLGLFIASLFLIYL